MDQQNIPDSYGTGKAPTQRSRGPFIIISAAFLISEKPLADFICS